MKTMEAPQIVVNKHPAVKDFFWIKKITSLFQQQNQYKIAPKKVKTQNFKRNWKN